MNAILLNTLTGAVSEYSNFDFQSVTPNHAGSDTGLFALGGNLDVAAPIASTVSTGKTLWGSTLKKYLQVVFLALKGSGSGNLSIQGATASYTYPVTVRASGESRAVPGRGIRENYLAFTYGNVAGADFQLDRIEVVVAESGNRRT